MLSGKQRPWPLGTTPSFAHTTTANAKRASTIPTQFVRRSGVSTARCTGRDCPRRHMPETAGSHLHHTQGATTLYRSLNRQGSVLTSNSRSRVIYYTVPTKSSLYFGWAGFPVWHSAALVACDSIVMHTASVYQPSSFGTGSTGPGQHAGATFQ